jgi:ABC-type antimicrobial peptide transport system permease subunit
VLAQGLGLSLAGVVVGLLGALALSRLLEKLLFTVSPTEPIIYAGVALLLLAITALASWLPARRAARVDPMIAMRVEG